MATVSLTLFIGSRETPPGRLQAGDKSTGNQNSDLCTFGIFGVLDMQDEMLPPEHMERMHKLLLSQKGKVSWLALHAGHMDAYETASEVTRSALFLQTALGHVRNLKFVH